MLPILAWHSLSLSLSLSLSIYACSHNKYTLSLSQAHTLFFAVRACVCLFGANGVILRFITWDLNNKMLLRLQTWLKKHGQPRFDFFCSASYFLFRKKESILRLKINHNFLLRDENWLDAIPIIGSKSNLTLLSFSCSLSLTLSHTHMDALSLSLTLAYTHTHAHFLSIFYTNSFLNCPSLKYTRT